MGIVCRREFQFHNGSIKGGYTIPQLLCDVCFNSTMVRLKDVINYLTYRATNGFQFHNGSIKGGGAGGKPAVAVEFQFHNGSIKGAEISVNILYHPA